MKNKLFKTIVKILEKHDFSLLWSLIVLWSSVVLILDDLPTSIQETIPYNGLLIGIIGVGIFLLKSFGIYYRKFMFHSVVDFAGATWLIFMGMVVSTSIPAMVFTGVILYVTGIMIDVRLVVRSFAQKRR